MSRGRGGKEPKGAFGKIAQYKMTPINRTAAIVTRPSQRPVSKSQKAKKPKPPKKKRWRKLSSAWLKMRFKQLQQLEKRQRQEAK